MSFKGLTLTHSGRLELAKAETGSVFGITHVVLGSGRTDGLPEARTELAEEVMAIDVGQIKRDGTDVIIECDFDAADAPRAFYFREIGIYANGVLCFYDNAGNDAEYIDPGGSAVVKQKRMRFVLSISAEVNVSVTIGSGLYALMEDLHLLDGLKLDKQDFLSEDDINAVFRLEYEEPVPGFGTAEAEALSATELLQILN